jgi:hypothetical protein
MRSLRYPRRDRVAEMDRRSPMITEGGAKAWMDSGSSVLACELEDFLCKGIRCPAERGDFVRTRLNPCLCEHRNRVDFVR